MYRSEYKMGWLVLEFDDMNGFFVCCSSILAFLFEFHLLFYFYFNIPHTENDRNRERWRKKHKFWHIWQVRKSKIIETSCFFSFLFSVYINKTWSCIIFIYQQKENGKPKAPIGVFTNILFRFHQFFPIV